MTSLETHVRIERTVEEVFDYVSDPLSFPTWNSAATEVSPISTGGSDGVGATYSIVRELLAGRVENVLEVVARERPRRFAIRTISGPTPFAYEFRFSADGSATVVAVELHAELGAIQSLLGPLAQVRLRRGVDANLATLKGVLETVNRR